MKLEIGMLIKVNNSEAYRIKNIDRRFPPYVHLVCVHPGNNHSEFYLNYWIEDELRSDNKTYCGHKKELDYDRITVLDNDRPIQMSLF